MQGGELIESGTHESLLAAKGAYYLLHEHQFKPALP
jgi:ABC-type multidrug transport system fused ATPase/permease subunit